MDWLGAVPGWAVRRRGRTVFLTPRRSRSSRLATIGFRLFTSEIFSFQILHRPPGSHQAAPRAEPMSLTPMTHSPHVDTTNAASARTRANSTRMQVQPRSQNNRLQHACGTGAGGAHRFEHGPLPCGAPRCTSRALATAITRPAHPQDTQATERSGRGRGAHMLVTVVR